MDSARHYFADYEAYDGGLPFAWGQVTLSLEAAAFSSENVVTQLRLQASRQHGIEASAIRLRSLCRL